MTTVSNAARTCQLTWAWQRRRELLVTRPPIDGLAKPFGSGGTLLVDGDAEGVQCDLATGADNEHACCAREPAGSADDLDGARPAFERLHHTLVRDRSERG